MQVTIKDISWKLAQQYFQRRSASNLGKIIEIRTVW